MSIMETCKLINNNNNDLVLTHCDFTNINLITYINVILSCEVHL